jgi:hypothetical protein
VRNQHWIATVALVFTVAGSVAAQQGSIRRVESPRQGPEIERSAVNFAGPWRPNQASGNTKVVGSVVDLQFSPVADVTVLLRNLDNGAVEQRAQTDIDGAYEFAIESSGTYVVEVVIAGNAVLALSNAGTVARYETLQTLVQLPGRWDAAARTVVTPQNMTGFFGVSAETSMTANTIGIAVDSNIAPADPGVPVSP